MTGLALDARNPFLAIGWTFGLFVLMHGHQYVGALIASWADRVSFDALMSGRHATPRSTLIRGLATIVVGLPLVWLGSTVLWNRPLAWMGFSFRWEWLLLGVGMGLLAPFVAVFILGRMRLAQVARARSEWSRSETLSAVVGLTAVAVFAGISEEIVFRGMLSLELSVAWGWTAAILVSGAIFGAVHLLGQLKTLTFRKVSAIMIASIAVSFLFVSLYRFSGCLWLPIGFHVAWNYAHSVLLGLPMNGEAPLTSCLSTELETRSFLAGGEAGMEASVPAIAIYCALGALFALL
jgi:membrane protease YdiL (CAAX protease family)